MTARLEIRAVLCIAGLFVAGRVWWCEDCRRGGWIDVRPLRHRRGCAMAETIDDRDGQV